MIAGPVTAFTNKANELCNRLISKVDVMSNGKVVSVDAQWDTGASGTCISEKVQQDLLLTAISKQKIGTPSGTADVDICLVDIILPNKVRLVNVPVAVTKIGSQGIGMLIGMNIILQGDFCVSNFQQKTAFTFRVPSQQTTDYVAEINFAKVIGPKHGIGKRKRKK